MKLRYIGPHDAVEVPLPDGSDFVTVAHGATFDFDDVHGASLLEQPTNWEDAAPAPTPTPATPAPARTTPQPTEPAPAESDDTAPASDAQAEGKE